MLEGSPEQAPARRGSHRARWNRGLDDELAFWRDWLATRGGRWAADYAFRTDPGSELQPHVRALIDAPLGALVRILDVGAGPLTSLGKRWPGREVRITPVDALADRYDQALAHHGVTPIVRTLRAEMETLREAHEPRALVGRPLEPGSFDLVYCRNALDHAYDPARALPAMLALAKPSACLLLEHLTDEAEHEAYKGLHQWNMRLTPAGPVIWSPDRSIDLGGLLGTGARVAWEQQDRWIRVVIRRGAGDETAAGRQADKNERAAL